MLIEIQNPVFFRDLTLWDIPCLVFLAVVNYLSTNSSDHILFRNRWWHTFIVSPLGTNLLSVNLLKFFNSILFGLERCTLILSNTTYSAPSSPQYEYFLHFVIYYLHHVEVKNSIPLLLHIYFGHCNIKRLVCFLIKYDFTMLEFPFFIRFYSLFILIHDLIHVHLIFLYFMHNFLNVELCIFFISVLLVSILFLYTVLIRLDLNRLTIILQCEICKR